MEELPAILDHIPAALLVIFRIGGIALFAPVVGSSAIPIRIRVLLAFILGLAVYPLLAESVLPATPLELDLWTLGPLIAVEIMLGAVIGFMATLPLVAAQTSGLVMGQQMGLGFARFYNPAIADEADIVGQLLFLMAMAGFLMIGGLEALYLAVINSFEFVPLGGFRPDDGLVVLLTGLLLSAFELALRVAAPLLALIFLQTIAMGFVAKTMPQLNILSLGFPLRILAGIFIVGAGLIAIDEVLMEGIEEMLGIMFVWLELG